MPPGAKTASARRANPQRLAAITASLYGAAALPLFWGSEATRDTVQLTLSVLLAAVLIALTVTDIRHFKLPDSLTFPLGAIGLAAAAYFGGSETFWLHGLAAILGFLGLYAVDRIYLALRGRHGLGLGDAKLFAAAGAWVGLEGLPSILLVASLLGLAAVVVVIAAGAVRSASGRSRGGSPRLTLTTALPFGPFLAAGLWLVWLYGPMI